MGEDAFTLAVHIAACALAVPLALLFWAVWRNWMGSPVGPRCEFGARLAPRPALPPPPPNPHLDATKPSFRLWGPVWLNRNYGTPCPSQFWLGHVHEHAAYRFYLRDDLPRTVWALGGAFQCGVRAGQWAAKLHALASAELAAREESVRIQDGPFTFELPPNEPVPQGLLAVAQATAALGRETLGFGPPPLMVTVLDDEDLPHDAGSRYAYLTRKRTGNQLCLLPNSTAKPYAAAEGFVWEYVRLALLELTGGRAPAWLTEGLAQWVASRVGVTVSGAGPPTPWDPTLGERALESVLGRSPIDCLVRRGMGEGDVVARLVEQFGTGALREFVHRLRDSGERIAFRRAFGVPQGSFVPG